MPTRKWLSSKDVALTVCFAALYVSLSFLPLFQIIGLLGKTITFATIMAPVIGIVLGPYRGTASTFLGGLIALFLNQTFSQPSLTAGVFAALCAGLLLTNRRGICILVYSGLLLLFGLFPYVGAFWLHPPLMWFQIAGFFILISPLQSLTLKSLRHESGSRIIYALFIVCLVSTLAGQIAGSLVYELIVDPKSLKLYWQGLTFVYPVERVIIALLSVPIAAPLRKILMSTGLLSVLK